MMDKNYSFEINYRFDLINVLIQAMGYKSYLEVGVDSGFCFDKIICEDKTGVDPYEFSAATIKKTSDEFFAENTKQFDIIFLDGLHHADQIYKDISNALKCLAPRGTIVVHDCNPATEAAQVVPRKQVVWNGDVWKGWVKLRTERSDLEMSVLESDHGLGIIKFGSQNLLIVEDELTYHNLEKNRKEWLNLVGTVNLLYHDTERE